MRCMFCWVALSVLASCSTVVIAQSVPATRVAYNTTFPTPTATVNAIGSGVQGYNSAVSGVGQAVSGSHAGVGEHITIPQQGSVDLGGSYSAPTSNYGSTSSYSGGSYAAPVYSGGAVSSAPVYASAPAHSYSPAPSHSYSSAPAYSAAPCNTGACGGGACSGCGSKSCLGGCRLGKLHGGGKGCGKGGSCGGWFGGAYYLHFWRDDDNFNAPLVRNSTTGADILSAGGSARMGDTSGVGVRLGKMLNQNTAVEFVYWQLFPDDSTDFAQASVVGSTLNSNLAFTGLTYDSTVGAGAVPVDDFFTDSQYMSITRSFDYRNFEANFLRLPYTLGSCGGGARLALLAGFRYFQADESLKLFSDDLNEIPGDDPNHELCYTNEVENRLAGFQVGGLLNYQMTSRLSGQVGSKVGIYNNRMRQTQAVFGGAGGAIIASSAQPFGLVSKKDDVAFLGEFDAGLAYCVNSNWRLSGGYKVLAISGYADSVNQIPGNIADISTTGLIQDNNSLILHGIYVGAEYSW